MKKTKIIQFVTLSLLFGISLFGQNEIELRTDGIVLPRLNNTSIKTAIEGQIIYDTIANSLFVFSGSGWQDLGAMSRIESTDGNSSIEAFPGGHVDILSNGVKKFQIDPSGTIALGEFTNGVTPWGEFHLYNDSSSSTIFRMQNGRIGGTVTIEMGGN